MSDTNRRAVLRSGAAIAATGVLGSIAGCSGILGGGGGGDLSYGDEIDGELTDSDEQDMEYRGYYDTYTFAGSEGDDVVIEMTSDGDPYIILLDPDGDEVAWDDDGYGSGFDSRLAYELEETGMYTIVATSFSSGAEFEYELELDEE